MPIVFDELTLTPLGREGEMKTDFAAWDLSGLDMVYAISQQHLNASLAGLLVEQAAPIAFSYAYPDTDFVPSSASLPAMISFSGTWLPALDGDGNVRVPIVDLSQNTLAAGQVVFTLTFGAGATFQCQMTHRSYTQPDPSAPSTPVAAIWGVQLTTSLSVEKLASEVPANVQAQLNALNGSYGDVFSLQQIVADLSTASIHASMSETPPTGVDKVSWMLLTQAFTQYYKDNLSEAKIPFAYLLTQNAGAPRRSPPAFTPTAVDFVIVPNSDQPGLSALAFAMMSQNRPLPGAQRAGSGVNIQLANLFTNIGFLDPDATGVAVLRQNLFTQVICDALTAAGVPAALSFYEAVSAPTVNNFATITQTADSSVPSLTLTDATAANSAGVLTTFNYARNDSNSGTYGFFNMSGWGGNSSVQNSLQVTASPATSADSVSSVTVSGNLVFKIDSNYYGPSLGSRSNSHSTELPPTTFNWSARFQLKNNIQDLGQINFDLKNSNFDSPPTSDDPSGLIVFMNKILAGYQTNHDLGGARTAVQTYIGNKFKPTLTNAFTSLQSFVVPGNNVFAFSGAAINLRYCLTTNFEYRDLGTSSGR